ncbi:MAG: DUF4040 domain-containing protein [Leptolyngbya sp. SIO3F4]|nr:DUF4040 domain-containing protein [Leptolyngbya sp. SIO3F4]
MQDGYVVAITALLPLTAAMVITQKDPYYALVMRGILGAVAALVYALFGAADVALTEALVGTMLSITLYAIAVRSSMTLRLGMLDDDNNSQGPQSQENYEQLFINLQKSLRTYHLRLEQVPYASAAELQDALRSKTVHGTCTLASGGNTYQLHLRVPKVYHMLKKHLPEEGVTLSLAAKKSTESTSTLLTESPYPSSSKA